MGFCIETISGLQNDSSKKPVIKPVLFLCLLFCKVYHFLMQVKKNKLTLHFFFTKKILVVTNIITTMFHNHKQITQSILGISPT